MRVLVTGGSGLVGRAIVSRLRQSGHEVVSLSRHGDELAAHALVLDLRRPGLCDRLAEEPSCQAIVHAAAAIDAPLSEIALTNCLGTAQMLELASRWNAGSFVFLSSLAVIGRPLTVPITEEHPVVPQTPYHASKAFGEQLTGLASRAGVSAVSLRLAAPVGHGMPERRILGRFVRRALEGEPLEVAGQGTRRQDYVDIRDIAAAVESCIDRRATGLLNIASGCSISNLELARACAEALGSSSPVRLTGAPDPEEGVSWEVSIEKAVAALGYAPGHSLADSIGAVAAEVEASAGV